MPKGNDSSISKIPLPLILTGTMPGRNSHEGLAMLGVNKDSPQTYTAGALLANGARITEIYPQYVVLEKNGRTVELYLQAAKSKGNAKALSEMLTVGGSPPSAPVVATHHEVLTDYIRPNPVYNGEVLKGYEVYAGPRPSVFSQMGLQAGDLITSINSVPLIDAASAMEQFKQLSEGNAVTATVNRKGKEMTLSLDGALITAEIERSKAPPQPMSNGIPGPRG